MSDVSDTNDEGAEQQPDAEAATTHDWPERPARFDTLDEDGRDAGLEAAALAVRRGELVILPTDTVYGIGCDAFDGAAVKRLLAAKGRGRDMPPPVLVSTQTTLDALASEVPEYARHLIDEFWPGPLTIVCAQQSSLQWDLGDTRGTVAVRMPDHDVALDLIQRTGPLAVSSANLTGQPAALDADRAVGMLADEVTVVLDAGPTAGELASTIVDCTGPRPRLLRQGALSRERLSALLDELGHPLEDERTVDDDRTDGSVKNEDDQDDQSDQGDELDFDSPDDDGDDDGDGDEGSDEGTPRGA